MVSEKKLFHVIHIMSLCQIMMTLGLASLDLRGTVGRIYEADYQTLLHTKYESSGPHGFIEYYFPIVSPWEVMTPACCHFGPQGQDWQDLCRIPLNIATY